LDIVLERFKINAMLNLFDRLLLMRKVDMFQELREDFLIRLVPVMEERTFKVKQPIFLQGEEGRSMFIVATGKIKIHLSDRTLKEHTREGFFGEMSLFDAEMRSASATAIEETTCLELTQQHVFAAIEETPGIAVNIIKILSKRIRALNQEKQELTALNEKLRSGSTVPLLKG
jgi:CRP/FNR family transcriptional regulator, cyclic AMP receptor protein